MSDKQDSVDSADAASALAGEPVATSTPQQEAPQAPDLTVQDLQAIKSIIAVSYTHLRAHET